MFTSILSALSQHKINSSASAHIVLLDGTCPVFTYKFTHNALFFLLLLSMHSVYLTKKHVSRWFLARNI